MSQADALSKFYDSDNWIIIIITVVATHSLGP